MVDIGNDYSHFTKIYPFAQRPDVGVDVLFFLAPADAGTIPYPHPFILRNWDRLEEMDEPDLGTKYDAKTYYHGPLPVNTPGTVCGTAEQWAGEIDYDLWLAGGYACGCPPMVVASYVASVRCDDDSLVVDPATDDVEVHINPAHTNTWTAEQNFNALVHIDVSALPSYLCFEITGDRGSGPVDNVHFWSDGRHEFFGNMTLGGGGPASGYKFRISHHIGCGGLLIAPISGSPVTGPFISFMRGGGSIQFQVDYDGSLWTNQTFAATTPGSIVAALPVYDADGNLVGHIPVYDSIT